MRLVAGDFPRRFDRYLRRFRQAQTYPKSNYLQID
jgi:hypothetical protein